MTPRELWIAALRSGEYKQGRGQLVSGNRFCCLGVACDVFWKNNPGKIVKTPISYGGHIISLPEIVQEWYGLSGACGSFDHRADSLLVRNDDKRQTFSEIADLIESEPKGLFKEAASGYSSPSTTYSRS